MMVIEAAVSASESPDASPHRSSTSSFVAGQLLPPQQ